MGRAPCVGRSLCVSGALCVGALCVGRSLVGPSPPVSDPSHVDIRLWDGSRSGARSHGVLIVLCAEPEHRDIYKGTPHRLPRPLLDQYPVRVCVCALCISKVPCAPK